MTPSDTPYDMEHIAGDGDYAIEVVSGSRHQERLEWLAQGRDEEPKEYVCTAVLMHEPDNPFDRNAVSVTILGVRVGFLPRDAAARFVSACQAWDFEQASCDAIIEGGWYRSADDKGDFSVRLDADPDFTPAEAAVEDAPLIEAAALPVAVAPRKSGFDFKSTALGAAATIALLAAVGVASLFVQTQDEREASRRTAVAALSQPTMSAVLPERRLASVEPSPSSKSVNNAEAGAPQTRSLGVSRSLQAAASPPARPGLDPKPSPLEASGPRTAAAVGPSSAEDRSTPSPEAALAKPSVTGNPGDPLAHEPAVVTRPREVPSEALPDTLIADRQKVIAALPPPVAEEVEVKEIRKHASVATVAAVADEAPPPVRTAVSPPPPPPPVPRPDPPASVEHDPTAAHAAKPERKAKSERRRSRLSARSRRARSYSRSRTRYSRRAARPAAEAGPARPGNNLTDTPAARMIQGWTEELTSASSRLNRDGAQ